MNKKLYSLSTILCAISVYCVISAILIHLIVQQLRWTDFSLSLIVASSLLLVGPHHKGRKDIIRTSIYAAPFLAILVISILRSWTQVYSILIIFAIHLLYNIITYWKKVFCTSNANCMIYTMSLMFLSVLAIVMDDISIGHYFILPILTLFHIFQVYRSVKAGSYNDIIAEETSPVFALHRSMTQVDDKVCFSPEETKTMHELFKKIEKLMREQKPYLRANYDLQDLSRDVFTNKVYISKTINIMAGMNFRQYLNHYRIKESLTHINDNPHLKVEDLYQKCGFHSAVTYTMAFKLNTDGDTPGEYIQRMRYRRHK